MICVFFVQLKPRGRLHPHIWPAQQSGVVHVTSIQHSTDVSNMIVHPTRNTFVYVLSRARSYHQPIYFHQRKYGFKNCAHRPLRVEWNSSPILWDLRVRGVFNLRSVTYRHASNHTDHGVRRSPSPPSWNGFGQQCEISFGGKKVIEVWRGCSWTGARAKVLKRCLGRKSLRSPKGIVIGE